MRELDVQAVVWKEGRQYVSQCLNFDIASYGTTEAKALANLKEAIELYLEDKKPHRPTRVQRPNVVSLKLNYA